MRKDVSLLASILLVLSTNNFFAQTTNLPSVSIDLSQLQKFHSSAVGDDYYLKIRLPFGYDTAQKKYPVLYLLDGDHTFGMATDIVQYLEYDNSIPELIIVSPAYLSKKLPNEGGNNHRERDFTTTPAPWNPDPAPFKYYSFLKNELIPFMDSHFRTDTTNRTLFGYSLSSGFALFSLFQEGQPFHRYILLEGYHLPAIQWERTYAKKHKEFPVTIFSGYGMPIKDQLNFNKAVLSRHYKGLQFDTASLSSMTHFAIAGEGLTRGLKAVFGASLSDQLLAMYIKGGLRAMMAQYNRLKSRFSAPGDWNWDHLDKVGNSLVPMGYVNDAIAVFKLNAELYPANADSFSEIAWAYEKLGDKKRAIEFYKKALNINSQDDYSIQRLKKLSNNE